MWDAEDATPPLTLEDGLKAAARARLTMTSKGQTLLSTAGNGHSVTFSLPAAGQGVTPTEIVCLCEELLQSYSDSSAALVASGVTTPTDEQILTEMLDRLQPVSRLEPSSFVNLRTNC